MNPPAPPETVKTATADPSPTTLSTPAMPVDATDPLSWMCTTDETPASTVKPKSKPKPKSNRKPAKAKTSASIGRTKPSFLFGGASKTYSMDGDGLRDAVKEGDV